MSIEKGDCLNLRYKQMLYKDVSAPPTEQERKMAELYGTWDSTACWCESTQGSRGPDDKPVNRKECARGRSCFKGLSDLA